VQKAYLSNLSTFRQFACHIIVHKRSIGSDGTFAHHLFACSKVLSQTAKDKKVLSLNNVVTLACMRRAQTFYMHIFAKIAIFCKIFKIIHVPVERQVKTIPVT